MSKPASGLNGWKEKLVVASLTLSLFAVVTLEQLPIGVVTLIASDFAVPPGMVGLGVTLTGLMAGAVALCAPVVMRGLDRRWALIVALISCVFSALASAFAQDLCIWLFSRLIAGVGVGIIFTVMSVVIASIVTPSEFPRVTTIVFSGVNAAVVLGMPLVTYLGSIGGWHLSFLVTMILALLPVFPVYLWLPEIKSSSRCSWFSLWKIACTKKVIFIVCLTVSLVFGHFLVYSYISPILQFRAGIGMDSVASLLLEFGAMALIGNFAIIPILKRGIGASLWIVNAGLMVSISLLFLVHSLPAATMVMAVWGLFLGPVSVLCQNWNLTQSDPQDLEAAQAISSAVFNVCIAGGAMAGGYLLQAAGQTGLIGMSLLVVSSGLVPSSYLMWKLYRRAFSK